jgi:hypothetical protein
VRTQRIIFGAYLVLIVVGLVYFTALGVAHR